MEPSSLEWSNCHWAFAVKRVYPLSSSPDDASTATSVPLTLRRWGPLNRDSSLIFREVTPHEVLGGGEDSLGRVKEAASASGEASPNPGSRRSAAKRRPFPSLPLDVLGADGVLRAVDTSSPYANPDVKGMALRARYSIPAEFASAGEWVPDPLDPLLALDHDPPPVSDYVVEKDVTIDWIDGALWLAHLEDDWVDNQFFFLAKAAMLWEAVRHNSTRPSGPAGGAAFESGGHPADGFVQWLPDSDIAVRASIMKLEQQQGTRHTRSRALWRPGAQWGPLPSLDNLIFTGPGAARLDDASQLGSWPAGVLGLIAAPTTRVFFNDAASKYNSGHLLCARRGGIVGSKPRIFSGRADAIVFRNRAYKSLGIEKEIDGKADMLTYPHFPPRHITYLSFSSNADVRDSEAVVDVLRATGLPVEVVNDVHKLSFEEQVRLMSRTGILVSPHHPALANLVFLPARSAVIELFPYGMKKLVHSNIASTADVFHFPVYTRARLPPDSEEGAASLMYSRYFHENCVAVNISSYDATSVHACTSAHKSHPVIVADLPAYRDAVTDAIDSIGAFSLLNPDWAEAAKAAKVRPPTYEEWVRDRPEHLLSS
jgi:hypothetical protein